jgi:KDO2-lipid IV(A) lauroyltransferase
MGRKNNKALDALTGFAFGLGQRLFLTRDVAKSERRGARLGDLAHRLDRKHRDRTLANLKLAFPEKSDSERIALCRECFRHWGRTTADFLRTPLRTDEEVMASIEVEGREFWDMGLPKGSGSIACTGHFGNFERFGQWSRLIGLPIVVVAREANQGAVQDRLEELRNRAGIEFMGRGNAARVILQKLRENRLVGLLPDQNSAESFLPFFGHPCGTVLGPAVLHIRTGAVMIPAFCARVGVGKYRVILREPIDYDNSSRDPEALMAAYNLTLESVIREFPEQYLWMHDRWKSARQRGLTP